MSDKTNNIKMKNMFSRRDFLKSSASAGLGVALAGRALSGASFSQKK